MNHLTEDELVLHYYGEEAGAALEAERHLEQCDECRALFGSVQRTLNAVDALPVPERGGEYGAEVWRRLEGKLPARSWWRMWSPELRWASAAMAMTVLLVIAFMAGRFYPNRQPVKPEVASDAQVRERVLLVAVGDYLDRSQMVLVELANTNAKGSLDISAAQERAQDLLSETRLYQQTAEATGDTSVSGILDDLERVMIEIAHGPSQMPAAELEKFRARLEAEGILFKIRVVNSNVRSQEEAPIPAKTGKG
jgi:hypothetical protein